MSFGTEITLMILRLKVGNVFIVSVCLPVIGFDIETTFFYGGTSSSLDQGHTLKNTNLAS